MAPEQWHNASGGGAVSSLPFRVACRRLRELAAHAAAGRLSRPDSSPIAGDSQQIPGRGASSVGLSGVLEAAPAARSPPRRALTRRSSAIYGRVPRHINSFILSLSSRSRCQRAASAPSSYRAERRSRRRRSGSISAGTPTRPQPEHHQTTTARK